MLIERTPWWEGPLKLAGGLIALGVAFVLLSIAEEHRDAVLLLLIVVSFVFGGLFGYSLGRARR